MLDYLFDEGDIKDNLSGSLVKSSIKAEIRLGSSVPKIHQADIPIGEDKLSAKIFGVDDDSYIHIGFTDDVTKANYEKLHQAMCESTGGQRPIPKDQLRHGIHCIVGGFSQRGVTYSRGILAEVKRDAETVKCLLYDEFQEVEVSRFQIFETNEKILSYSQFVLKCKLVDLECFLGFPFLKLFFQEHLQKVGSAELLGPCKVKIEGDSRAIPTIDITFPGRKPKLQTSLREYLPTFGKLEYLPPSVPVRANLVSMSSKGVASYQPSSKFQLIDVVNFVLEKYDKTMKQHSKKITLEDYISWQQCYLSRDKKMYIARDPKDKHWYRATINEEIEIEAHGKLSVTFIDYGRVAVVNERDLYSAYLTEPNLRFIPPQSLSIRFSGTKYETGIRFNKERFWKYACCQPVSIVLKEDPKEKAGAFPHIPEANILARNAFSDPSHPGYSLEEVYQMIEAASKIQLFLEDVDENGGNA